MKDIDYEELDKAMNQLMSDSPAIDSIPSDNSASPTTVPTAPTTSTTDRPIPSLAGRRNGRFMDVVNSGTTSRPATTSQSSSAPVEVPASTPLTETTPTPQSEDTPKIEEPQSPFIPDAQVEKRPLGAFSSTESISGNSDDNVITADSEINNSTPAVATPLPAELQSDVLLVESSSVAKDYENIDAPVQDDVKPEVEQPKDQAFSTSSMTQTPGNIPLSSFSKTESTNQASPAIYDEENTVNQAIVDKKKPKKKGGIVKIILWVLLLVLLGVGAGAVVYFVVLPNFSFGINL